MTRDGVAAGLVAGAVACLMLAPWAVGSVTRLHDARRALADLNEQAKGSVKQPPSATSRASATAAALQTRLRTMAARGGVLVESARPAGSEGGVVMLDVRISGASKAVIALADSIERDAPLTRWSQWRAVALPNGGLRVEGRMVAAWR